MMLTVSFISCNIKLHDTVCINNDTYMYHYMKRTYKTFKYGREEEMAELHVHDKIDPTNPKSSSFEARKRQLEEDERREKEELQRQKKSPYRSEVQMNKDAYKAEDWLMSKSPIAYRIFKFLINNMDSYNAVMCSQTVLQEQFDVS